MYGSMDRRYSPWVRWAGSVSCRLRNRMMTVRGGGVWTAIKFLSIKNQVAELLPEWDMTKHGSPETRFNTFGSMRVSSMESPTRTQDGCSLWTNRSNFSSNG